MWTNKVLPPTSCMLFTAQRYTPSNGNSYLCLCPAVHRFFHIHNSNLRSWAQTGWRGWPFRGWRWCWCDDVEAHAEPSEQRLSRISPLLAAPATGHQPSRSQQSAASGRSEAVLAATRPSPPPCLVSPMTLAIITIIITIIMHDTVNRTDLAVLCQAIM